MLIKLFFLNRIHIQKNDINYKYLKHFQKKAKIQIKIS